MNISCPEVQATLRSIMRPEVSLDVAIDRCEYTGPASQRRKNVKTQIKAKAKTLEKAFPTPGWEKDTAALTNDGEWASAKHLISSVGLESLAVAEVSMRGHASYLVQKRMKSSNKEDFVKAVTEELEARHKELTAFNGQEFEFERALINTLVMFDMGEIMGKKKVSKIEFFLLPNSIDNLVLLQAAAWNYRSSVLWKEVSKITGKPIDKKAKAHIQDEVLKYVNMVTLGIGYSDDGESCTRVYLNRDRFQSKKDADASEQQPSVADIVKEVASASNMAVASQMAEQFAKLAGQQNEVKNEATAEKKPPRARSAKDTAASSKPDSNGGNK